MQIKFKTRKEARIFVACAAGDWKVVDTGNNVGGKRWAAEKLPVKKVTLETLVRTVKKSKGKIFTAKFVKADGSIRVLTGRTGVQSKRRGGMKTYNGLFEDAGNIGVFDMKAKDYRAIKAKRLLSVKIDGVSYKLA